MEQLIVCHSIEVYKNKCTVILECAKVLLVVPNIHICTCTFTYILASTYISTEISDINAICNRIPCFGLHLNFVDVIARVDVC